jgi:ketopantoate reductase
MKVTVVGAGAVGSACLLSLIMRGSAREVVLVVPRGLCVAGNRNDFAGLPIFTDSLIGDTSVSPPSRTTSSGRLHGAANRLTYPKSALWPHDCILPR